MAANHIEKQSGNPSASNPPFLPYTSTTGASTGVHSQFTSELKTSQNQTVKRWQSEMNVQGRKRKVPGTRKLESSQLTRQLLWAHIRVWESTQKACIAKTLFFTTKASTSIILPNHWSVFSLILVCQSKPKHPAFGLWLDFPGHTVFSWGYGIAEWGFQASSWRLMFACSLFLRRLIALHWLYKRNLKILCQWEIHSFLY